MRYSIPTLVHNNEESDESEGFSIDRSLKTFTVFDAKGRKKLTTVEARDMSAAADLVEKLWPCILKADHLPYPFVTVERGGTLDLTA
jgi:hypothetical protein